MIGLVSLISLGVLGITLYLTYHRQHWFLNDSATKLINPYKLVYRVSKFASSIKIQFIAVPLPTMRMSYLQD